MLRSLKPWLAEQGVSKLSLFGSFARDEAGPNSDVDLLAEFSRVPGLAFFALERELSTRLGRRVEVTTLAAMPPRIRSTAMSEAVDV